MKTIVALVVCVGIATPAAAQIGPDQWAQDNLRWTGHEHAADIVSTVMVGVALALPCLNDRTWHCVANEGIQVTVGLTGTEIAKRAIHRQRPNRHDRKSFPSMHTILACVAVGRTTAWMLCPAVGYMRVAADWHWASDTAVGGGAGLLLTTISWGK